MNRQTALTFSLLVALLSVVPAALAISSPSAPLQVREEVPVGTVVGTLTVPPEIAAPSTSSSPSPSIVLALTRATPGARLFTLEAAGAPSGPSAGTESGPSPTSGSAAQQQPVTVLKVADRIDRDTLCATDGLCCERERLCSVPLVVAAQVGAQRPTFTATVVIEDVNDNVPAWPPETHELLVSVVEHTRTGAEFAIEPLAFDADSRAFTITRYELVPVASASPADAGAGTTAAAGATGLGPFDLKITRESPPLGTRYSSNLH